MAELVHQIVEASKVGPLFIGGPADRWAGCAYDDGEGGVVWIDIGLWLQDMVSSHPMHLMGVPIIGWGDHWLCEKRSGEYVPVYLAPRWHRQVDQAWREWRTKPEGWRETIGLNFCRSVAPRVRV
ncbi:hypothetical protein [Geminicoccus harenae]|uniref:hypothetical protein n=1 Tax=Geminicoccus harenae TaxID=2498453 RepID=UPI00168AC504|nr:hypothetical protein [Geminicoccus harenae]